MSKGCQLIRRGPPWRLPGGSELRLSFRIWLCAAIKSDEREIGEGWGKKKEPSDHVKGKTGEQREWVQPFVCPPSSCHPSAAGVELLKCHFRKTAASQRVSDCSAPKPAAQPRRRCTATMRRCRFPTSLSRQQRVRPSSPLGVWEWSETPQRSHTQDGLFTCAVIHHSYRTHSCNTDVYVFFSSWSLGNAEWRKYWHTHPRQDHRSSSSAVFSRGIDTYDEWSLRSEWKKSTTSPVRRKQTWKARGETFARLTFYRPVFLHSPSFSGLIKWQIKLITSKWKPVNVINYMSDISQMSLST